MCRRSKSTCSTTKGETQGPLQRDQFWTSQHEEDRSKACVCEYPLPFQHIASRGEPPPKSSSPLLPLIRGQTRLRRKESKEKGTEKTKETKMQRSVCGTRKACSPAPSAPSHFRSAKAGRRRWYEPSGPVTPDVNQEVYDAKENGDHPRANP